MVCGALKCSKVISVTNAPKLHVISSETRLSSELFGTIDLVQCDECGHIFNCSPSDGEIESSHDLFLTNTPISETMISRHEQTVDFLTSGVERKIRVLDVGAGSGALAAAFAKRGHEVTVVEPSSKIDGQALARFGVDVIKDFWPTVRLEGREFDLILCVQVLEHIGDPCAFMSSLQSSLDEEGKIYLEVPSGDWVVEHASLGDISYPHQNYYLDRVLNRIIRSVSLEVAQYRKILEGRDSGFVLRGTKVRQVELALVNEPENTGIKFETKLKIAESNCHDLLFSKKFAIYGATCGSQAMFGFFPQIKPEFIIDDTPSYEGAFSYSSEARFKIVKPTAEVLRSIETVLIAAYIHDKVISEKIRAAGFVGDIYSLRPPSDDSGTVRSLFAA
jgi:2-polyprenyl-3-methyl-5-hydroxy-6-metoxy-1,4-benzoquinol methylase